MHINCVSFNQYRKGEHNSGFQQPVLVVMAQLQVRPDNYFGERFAHGSLINDDNYGSNGSSSSQPSGFLLKPNTHMMTEGVCERV